MPRWKDKPREGIKFLRDAFQRLRKNKSLPELKGGCYTIEVVPKEDGYHIHMHIIVDANFIAQKRLMAAWGEIIEILCPSVDIRDASGGAAAKYVSKYVTKGLGKNATPAQFVDLWEAIRGSRLFALFGTWYRDAAKLETLMMGKDKPQAVCPHCKAVGTCFDPRFGRQLFGEFWDTLEGNFRPPDGKYSRPKKGMSDESPDPSPPDIGIEFDGDECLLP